MRSFLFTLRNPHGVAPRKLLLKVEKKQYAIYCKSTVCAAFGYYDDIHVCDNCNRNSVTRIGTRWSDSTYANDTAFEDFLPGTEEFTVKQIEVFEIADYTALPADVKTCANGRLFQERVRDAGAGAAGRLRETQAGDRASRKATNTRGGCSWRTSSRGRRGECRMCSREEDERLGEVKPIPDGFPTPIMFSEPDRVNGHNQLSNPHKVCGESRLCFLACGTAMEQTREGGECGRPKKGQDNFV
jgi:hypothetical protein